MDLVREAITAGVFRESDTAIILYDMDTLEAGWKALQGAFPQTALAAVAVKANPLPPLVTFLAARGAGAEVASLPELRLALAAGVPATRIVFDSPAKTVEELREAVRLGVHINADNLDELDRLAMIAAEADMPVPSVGLRVNPQIGLGRIRATSVAGRYSKFGVPLAQQDRIMAAFSRYPWLCGLHVHIGSQGCPLELLVAGTAAVFDLAEAINRTLGPGRVRLFDIGGGLPAAYDDTALPPDARTYAAALRDRCPALFAAPYRIIMEFGRMLHAPCAVAVSRVEYVKRQAGHRTAVLHLGADAFVRECYHPKAWPHRAMVLDATGKAKEGRTALWHLAGPLCFSGDFPIRRARLPQIAPGDLVVIRDVGAYTVSMWSRYNSRQIPRIVGRFGGTFLLLRERETPEDVLRFWQGTAPAGTVND